MLASTRPATPAGTRAENDPLATPALARVLSALSSLKAQIRRADEDIADLRDRRARMASFVRGAEARLDSVASTAELDELLKAAKEAVDTGGRSAAVPPAAAPADPDAHPTTPPRSAESPGPSPASPLPEHPPAPLARVPRPMKDHREGCAACGVTRSPEWRSIVEEDGSKKVYCNACGLRISRRKRASMNPEEKAEKKKRKKGEASGGKAAGGQVPVVHVRLEGSQEAGYYGNGGGYYDNGQYAEYPAGHEYAQGEYQGTPGEYHGDYAQGEYAQGEHDGTPQALDRLAEAALEEEEETVSVEGGYAHIGA
ncbi:hypothetical protein DFJ74DRAFT_678741 [Hyaloraphidium curvatum]|nr:hypothetical protein DFJ74DRAFT_678741 [Hyaloraphidium curvatum]